MSPRYFRKIHLLSPLVFCLLKHNKLLEVRVHILYINMQGVSKHNELLMVYQNGALSLCLWKGVAIL